MNQGFGPDVWAQSTAGHRSRQNQGQPRAGNLKTGTFDSSSVAEPERWPGREHLNHLTLTSLILPLLTYQNYRFWSSTTLDCGNEEFKE